VNKTNSTSNISRISRISSTNNVNKAHNTQSNNKLKCTVLFSLILVVLCNSVVFAQNNSKRKSTKANASEAITAVNTIPYSLDVTEESTKKGLVIILAVEQVTIIHCPEEPRQILFGNSEGIDVSETKPGRTEIYLRPRLAQINTNVVVEMESGPIILYLRTIEIKGGAKVGQFTSEVVIKNSAYKESLVKAKDELEKANKEIVSLKGDIEKVSLELKEKNEHLCQEGKKDLVRIVETSLQLKEKRNTVTVQIPNGKAKVHQLGRMQRTNQGLLVNIAVENLGKDFISIDGISSQSGNIITNTIGNTRRVSAKAELNFSFLIEDNQGSSANTSSDSGSTQEANLANELTIIINQTPVKLKIS
jgi:hypothetical protein